MKQLMPSAVMQASTASEIGTANAAKVGHKSAETAISGGFSADSSGAGTSFLDSLANLVTADGAKAGASGQGMAGNSLPLAGPTAITGLVDAFDVSTDGGLHNPVPVAGLPPGSQQDAAEPGTATLAELSRLIARTPPKQGVTATAAKVSQLADTSSTTDHDAVALQAEAAQHKAGNSISVDASIARLQRGLSDVSSNPEAAIRESVNKTGSVDPPGKGGAVELQSQGLKTAALMSETDQLFTSRIQLATLNQAAELGAQKHAVENQAMTTQANTSDALHASLSRAPMPQMVMTTEPGSTSTQTMITETFGRPEWNQGMGKQILWMVNQNISRAEIRLNPANLGPLEVRVDMENDQVNVAFTSRHADVREAVEQALPRLREMLEEKGLNLADADVSHHSFAERQQAFAQTDSGEGRVPGFSYTGEVAQPGEDGLNAVPPNGVAGTHGQGLVDYYI